MLRWLARIIVRYPGRVVLLGALLTIPCAYWTSLLYSNLKLELEELLPRKAQSVQDLNEVRSRLRSTENLAVLVFSQDISASRRFVDDLVARLRRLPRDTVASVEHRIQGEIEFFERRKALFIELGDLRKLRRYVEARLEYERELYNPLNIFSEVEIPEPRFDLRRFLLKYRNQKQAERFNRYPDGYYATPDGKKRAVLVYLPAGKNTVSGRLHLKAELEKEIRELRPASYAGDLEIHYTGEVQNNIDEYEAVLGDIERSAVFVTSAVCLVLLIYFRTFLGVAALLVSLLMARLWAFSLVWFKIGYLNANSAFMGSIVLGSGITYGVMFLSRYLEERRARREPHEAAGIAMAQTARATWTAALAAGLAYGALALTEFEGFRQYGFIGFAAMLLCWVSAFTLLPALVLLAERLHPLISSRESDARGYHHRIFGPVANAIGRHPKAVLAVSAVLTGLSVLSLASIEPDRIIEANLSKLRSKKSLESGSGFWARDQDEIFRSYLSPMVVLTRSEAEAARLSDALKARMRAEGDRSLVVSVLSIRDFVASRQARKIQVLREIQGLLPPRILARLPAPERKLAHSLMTPEAFRPFGIEDLPELIRNRFTEKGGELGRLVLVEPPLGSAKWRFDQLDRFVSELRETANEVAGPRPPVAGSHAVTRDMFHAIYQDGPKATLAAFGAVVLLITLLFRRPAPAGMVLLSLLLGVLWMSGAALAIGVRINFLNFIALPITFGIGADYGINILERYRNDPERDVIKALRETGSAVTLCSVTTILGYFSLIIASNQAFVSFGLLAVAGELGTMLAAIMTLPAALLLIERRQTRKQDEEKQLEETRSAA